MDCLLLRTVETGGLGSVKSLLGTGLARCLLLWKIKLRKFIGAVESQTKWPAGDTQPPLWEVGTSQGNGIRKRAISGKLWQLMEPILWEKQKIFILLLIMITATALKKDKVEVLIGGLISSMVVLVETLSALDIWICVCVCQSLSMSGCVI